MSQLSRKAVFDAARQALSPAPSSTDIDWMAAALSQMEAPLPQASAPLVSRMINSLGTLPTALLGVGV